MDWDQAAPTFLRTWARLGFALVLALAEGAITQAQSPPRFTDFQLGGNRELTLVLAGEAGRSYEIDVSPDLQSWQTLVTLRGAATMQHVDSATPALTTRFYRARRLPDATNFTGDHLATTNGDVVLHPVNHASLVLKWRDRVIYVDPVGGAGPYSGLPKPDLILVTHGHGDHLNADTLNALRQEGTAIIAPAAVYSGFSAALKALTTPLANGGNAEFFDIRVEAHPAYNANHPKGVGNSYVLTVGGRRLYFSGDTEDVPEMRSLTGIDVAFLCMNVPFTMTIAKAASAVRAFQPRVVYPYHYRNSDGSFADLAGFQKLVGTDVPVEVRRRNWY